MKQINERYMMTIKKYKKYDIDMKKHAK